MILKYNKFFEEAKQLDSNMIEYIDNANSIIKDALLYDFPLESIDSNLLALCDDLNIKYEYHLLYLTMSNRNVNTIRMDNELLETNDNLVKSTIGNYNKLQRLSSKEISVSLGIQIDEDILVTKENIDDIERYIKEFISKLEELGMIIISPMIGRLDDLREMMGHRSIHSADRIMMLDILITKNIGVLNFDLDIPRTEHIDMFDEFIKKHKLDYSAKKDLSELIQKIKK